ncbi:chemotaxis protein CheD [Halobaculum sp. D14]|uniref:chemotaxis protein CheD n=1 Tax=unclassified Halobaculum TaxID=2640896 RepID=UPI003EBF11DB
MDFTDSHASPGGDAAPPTEFTIDGAPRRKVGLSEHGVATDGAVLVTSGLGSCLGVTLYHPRTETGGLLHAMLPAAADRPGPETKFVAEGVGLLVDELVDAGAARGELRAKLVGGAAILNLDLGDDAGSIGERNVAAAEAVLERLDVPVVADDTGGDRGRSIQFDTASGDLRISYADGSQLVL